MHTRKLLPLIATILFVAGCDSMTQVSRTPLGSPRQETRSQSCSYAGLCQACELRTNGKTKCFLGYHQSCDGHRDARVNIQDFTVRYKDGHSDTESTESVASFLTDCK
jgi:hypothetical protein